MIEKRENTGYTKNIYRDKMKVYLDTSVISYLHQKDSYEKMQDTLELWNRFEKGELEKLQI